MAISPDHKQNFDTLRRTPDAVPKTPETSKADDAVGAAVEIDDDPGTGMEEATLKLDVRFDPAATDAESVATALDRLLETAMSTPKILDEYGDVRVDEFFVECNQDTTMSNRSVQCYRLAIDGPAFRCQRELLLKLQSFTENACSYTPGFGDADLFSGLINLTDELADQAHDNYGIDCLLKPAPCECEKPGYFCSGVPGILAHIEDGRLAPGAKVERCDLCRRYPTDKAALARLRELGHAPS